MVLDIAVDQTIRAGLGGPTVITDAQTWSALVDRAQTTTPVALGRRGDLVGWYHSTRILLLGAYVN
jgi:hypothetical protein